VGKTGRDKSKGGGKGDARKKQASQTVPSQENKRDKQTGS